MPGFSRPMIENDRKPRIFQRGGADADANPSGTHTSTSPAGK
jgi:hypothetical protein